MRSDVIRTCSALSSLLRRLASQPERTENVQEFVDVVKCIASVVELLGSAERCEHTKIVSRSTQGLPEDRDHSHQIIDKIYDCTSMMLSQSVLNSVLHKALLSSLCENLPGVMTYLLDSYVVIGPQLPLEHHRSFVSLLLASPGTAALSSLASHLSLVSSHSSGSTQDTPGGFDGPAISTHESQQPEVFISQRKTTVLVQSALTHFVANILSARISAEPIQVASILPDGSKAARAELSRQTELSEAAALAVPPPIAARPLFQQLLREAATLSTPMPRSTAAHSGDPGPADPSTAAAADNFGTALMDAPRALATRMHAQSSRLLGLPDVAASNCAHVPPLLRLPQLLPRLLSDAAAAATAAAATDAMPQTAWEPTAATASPTNSHPASVRPDDDSASAAELSGAMDRPVDPAFPDPAAAAARGGGRQCVAPEATAYAAATLDSNQPTDGTLPEWAAAPGSYTAALCGLRVLLSVATIRGHAHVAARWCMHAMQTQACHYSGSGDVSGAPTDPASTACQPERPPGTHACMPAALAQISDTGVHERLWHALLMHAAAAAPDSAALPVEGSGERPGVGDVLSVLWRDGTARALPEAQHVTFLLQLQAWRGRPLPPQAQLLLLRQVVLQSGPHSSSGAHPCSPAAWHDLHPDTLEAMALDGATAALLPSLCSEASAVAAPSGTDGSGAQAPAANLTLRVAEGAAAAWAAASGALGSADPPPVQAAATFLLLLLLAAVGNAGIDRSGSLLRSILQGVNARLTRGMTDGPAARQGKRVARLFSEILTTSASATGSSGASPPPGQADDVDGALGADEAPEVLYSDEDLSLLLDELWWAPRQPRTRLPATASRVTAPPDSAANGPFTDSDDSDAASEVSVEVAGGAAEEDRGGGGRALDLDKKWRPVHLHTLAAAMRDSTKTVAQAEALQKLEQLVRASPATEVAKAAPELLRTLIFSPPPEWASQQTPASDALHPERRRLGSLAAVLAAAPHAAPGAAISHLFTEHLDVSQRLLVLDGLCAAAHELAGRPLLPPLTATRDQQGAGEAAGVPSPALLGGKYDPAKTRVWGTATLRKLQGGPPDAAANRFAVAALPWTVELLTRAAEDSRGALLFRTQTVVFGRLLTTLGTFCHCARLTPDADRLCMVVLQLLLDEPVAEHADPFVRKSALVATAELLRALPAARLAGAMMRSHGCDAAADDSAFAARLTQLHEQLRIAHATSPDATLRNLAGGCLALQSQLADEALACIEADARAEPPAESQSSIILPPW